MTNNTTQTEAIGIRVVSQLVIEHWNSRFQELSARNDDGIDGIIFLGKHRELTGEVIFVQIKCGEGYRVDDKKRKNHIKLKLGKKYLNTHRPRWNSIPGPVVLVYVDPSTSKHNPKAWWVDLKSSDAYDQKAQSYVLVPKENSFGQHSKGYFKNLGRHHLDYNLPEITARTEDFVYLHQYDSLKYCARYLYRALAKQEIVHPTLGQIHFTRVGWRHLTRRGRRKLNMMQSFMLLGSVQKILGEVESYEIVGKPLKKEVDGQVKVIDYIAIRSKVGFPFRYQGVIVVILKRKKLLDLNNGNVKESKIWFYSIFESRRGKIIF
nr:DUF4365 domain-containing protein [Allomuricauda sp.]